jgi:hypothetical protein
MQDKKEQETWETWLVEAVRKIRAQKQRPGLDRIYNAVRLLAEKEQQADHEKKSPIAPIYHIKFDTIQVATVQKQLDRVVSLGLLFKVISKGQLTYKTPDKCERTLKAGNDDEVRDFIYLFLHALVNFASFRYPNALLNAYGN